MARLFLSYSHADEGLKKDLLAHMANLRREGNHIWHDRMLIAGDELDPEIKKELESADIILLLISHHFLDSYYCFEIEFKTAVARAKAGQARIIPIILDHCDWTATEIPKRLATPRDGNPIATWPNRNEAFLDVVKEIRRALASDSQPPEQQRSQPSFNAPVSSLPQVGQNPNPALPNIPKTFTDLDKRRAVEAEFQTIRSFFQKGIELIEADASDASAELIDITTQRFVASLYREGKLCHEIAVWRGGFGSGSDGLSYHLGTHISHTAENSFSGWITIKETDDGLVPELSSTSLISKPESSAPAPSLWDQFVRPLSYR